MAALLEKPITNPENVEKLLVKFKIRNRKPEII